ncbi:hypothetical protein AaE_009680 [Aphanomyces astaci]|uniref:Uncharacterized protein n=1 Tax=Aphanomyces astaci TaxID=112090 RepID=A0A6A5ABQ9_APHAT|nr:hypothetical protein AaE_009680 [Aphanomyces astaci]
MLSPPGILHATAVERSAIVDTYLESTQLQGGLEAYWSSLMSSTCLSPNPYPQLLRHFRSLEGQSEPQEFRPSAVQSINVPPISLNVGSVAGGVFGHARLLSVTFFLAPRHRIDGPSLMHLSKRLGCTWYKQQRDDSYKATVMTSLVGPAVLHGKGYLADVYSVQLEQHVLVEGEKLERAITVFAQLVAKDAYDNQTSATIMNQGVWVTIPSFKKSDRHTEKLWTLDAIQSCRVAFISAVKTAVAARVPCYVVEFRHSSTNSVHERRPSSPRHDDGQTGSGVSYVRVHRTFVMHFKPPNEPTRSFSVNQLRPLLEGVFFTEVAMTTYISVVLQGDDIAAATVAFTKPFVTSVLDHYTTGNYLEMMYALVHHICVNESSLDVSWFN